MREIRGGRKEKDGRVTEWRDRAVDGARERGDHYNSAITRVLHYLAAFKLGKSPGVLKAFNILRNIIFRGSL